jgi:hypothetical protein
LCLTSSTQNTMPKCSASTDGQVLYLNYVAGSVLNAGCSNQTNDLHRLRTMASGRVAGMIHRPAPFSKYW